MVRRRSVPWIQRYSRLIIAGICVIGLIITSYLTVHSFAGDGVACPVDPATGKSSCDAVLNSSYAKIFGLPLSLYGLLAYISMLVFSLSPLLLNNSQNKKLRTQVEDITWQFLFIGGTAMAVFSGYLMYIAFFVLKATCYYCVASALCSLSLFVMSIIGRVWDEIGPLLFRGVIIGMVTLVATIGVYATANPNANADNIAPNGKIYAPPHEGQAQPPIGWEVTTTSGESEIALAEHLASIGAKEYAAFWCPFCYMQKQLFGKEAAKIIPHVECDPSGLDPDPQACRDAGVKAFPTWVINGQIHEGLFSLEQLAELSGYQGPSDFKYTPGKVTH
jgi:uncharacterized membrane protein